MKKKIVNFADFQNIKENKEEEFIHPEHKMSKFGISNNEKIERIEDFLEDADDEVIDQIINMLRSALLEMEQQGFIDAETTDTLDETYGDNWIGWISAVIELDEFPEEGLNKVYEIVQEQEESYSDWRDSDDNDDEVTCPDCDGTGQDEMGENCERCDGGGRVYRPDDIPPDEFDYYEDDDDLEFED